MSPPTSIDGTDITGATIDGTDVTEITVDGQTVFTAVPPLPASVEHRWKMDTGSGSTAFDSVGSDDGTINGATWQSDTDAVGGAYLDFDGSGDNVNIPTSINSSTFFVAAWVNWDGSSNFDVIMGRDSNNNYAMIIDGADQEIGLWDSGLQVKDSLSSSDGWTHYVTTSDGSGSELFVDGVSVDTGPSVNIGSAGKIGESSDGGEAFDGELDDVMIGNVKADASLSEDLLKQSPRGQ